MRIEEGGLKIFGGDTPTTEIPAAQKSTSSNEDEHVMRI